MNAFYSVCHLAGVFLDKLILNHADDGIDLHVSKKERIMVQIAALCHDLGMKFVFFGELSETKSFLTAP